MSLTSALVVRIRTKPHPKADRLLLGTCSGYQVIVSTDTVDNELGLFFPPDSQVGEEFCTENNLYRAGKGINKNPEKFGFFDHRRKVDTLKLRGEISEGFWIPVSALNFTGITPDLKEGDTVNTFGKYTICQKYYSPQTLAYMAKEKKKSGGVKGPEFSFEKHYDTPQLRYMLSALPDQMDDVVITEKLHGTSGRTGNVLCTDPLSKWKIIWNTWFGWVHKFLPKTYYKKVSGTRNCILSSGANGEIGATYRQMAHDQVNPLEDEIIYYELVGYMTPGASLIMAEHSASSKPGTDPLMEEINKKYGPRIAYTYGCFLGEYDIYIYRITQNGKDLTWDQLVERSKELSIQTVPVLYRGSCTREELHQKTIRLSNGPSTLDTSHPREGVCVRVESPYREKAMKYKGIHFCHLEGIKKNDDQYIDLEDIS